MKIIKKVTFKIPKSTKAYLEELSLLTGISLDGIITGILWDYVLKEHDKKKGKKSGSK